MTALLLPYLWCYLHAHFLFMFQADILDYYTFMGNCLPTPPLKPTLTLTSQYSTLFHIYFTSLTSHLEQNVGLGERNDIFYLPLSFVVVPNV